MGVYIPPPDRGALHEAQWRARMEVAQDRMRAEQRRRAGGPDETDETEER